MTRYERLLAIAGAFLLVVGVAVAAQPRGEDATPRPEVHEEVAGDQEQDPEAGDGGGVEAPVAPPTDADERPVTVADPGADVPGEQPGEQPGEDPSPSPTSAPSPAPTQSPGPSPSPTPTPSPSPTWPSSGLFAANEDRIGITDTEIRICMHAAFLLGSVFDNRPDDERVYWDMVNEEQGGVHGRRVEISFTDDQYTPAGARQAAAQCKDRNPFLIVGGVGFDQTPAVRQFAEENRIPYVHSVAVREGAENFRYSFTPTVSIEDMGRMVAQVAAREPDRKHGILWVNSENWKAGRDAYRAEAERLGVNVVYDDNIGSNNDDLTTKIVQMRNAEVEVIYLHVNALAMSKFFVQADQQDYYPKVLGVAGFDLVTDTAGDVMTKFEPAEIVWVTPAYRPEDPSSPYRAEIQRMQRAYEQYRPGKTPNDVDWMFWLAFKGLHQQLLDCGPDCTRNTFTGMMTEARYSFTPTPMCNVDFGRSASGNFGGYLANLYRAIPLGERMVWGQAETCQPRFR